MKQSTSRTDDGPAVDQGPVGRPTPHVVQEMRRIFRVFVEPPNRFNPKDVWGALFYSRLEFAGDFMPWGKPVTVEHRAQALTEACKFWVNEARDEMTAAGYWPRLEVSPYDGLYFSLHELDAWLTGVMNPVLDDEEVEGVGPERALQIKQLWKWCLDNATKAGRADRRSALYAVSRALQSVGLKPESEEELVLLAEELFRGEGAGPVLSYHTKKRGDWRISWRDLRDGNPKVRKMRQRRRKSEKPAISLDAPRGKKKDTSLAKSVPSRDDGPVLEMLANQEARDAAEAVDVFRRVCEERAELPPRRKDDVVGPLVRRNLYAVARGEVRRSDLAREHGVDKGNLSRAYRRELAAAIAETHRRLAS